MEHEDGVFVLIVVGKDNQDDDIENEMMVDAGMKVIVDLCECFELTMTWKYPRLCKGNAQYRGFSEIRQVHHQSVVSKNRKDNRILKRNKTQLKQKKQLVKRNNARHLQLFRNIVVPHLS